MIRRVHVAKLSVGSLALPASEAHHLRDVLRLEAGATLELFDDVGNIAQGTIRHINIANVVVDVAELLQSTELGKSVIVAAAVPKGDRADWMVEKLTELGVKQFVPLITQRSVVLPAGKNKVQRWERIAIESAKQSRRVGVMTIADLTPLDAAIQNRSGTFLSTLPDAPAMSGVSQTFAGTEMTLLIGPEGGWTIEEAAKMTAAGFVGSGLTSTILRVETAAVVAAGVLLCTPGWRARHNS